MSDHWEIFIREKNDHIAFIRFDIGMQEEVPVKEAISLIILKLQTKRIFSKKLDFNLLNAFEDDLLEILTEQDYYVGVMTVQDARFFYLYSSKMQQLEQRLRKLLATHKRIACELSVQEDPEWITYKDLLCPDLYEQQWIANRNLVENLKGHQDPLHIPREVNHWIYFADETSRESFKAEVVRLGFEIASEHQDDEWEKPYQLVLSHESSVDLDTIHQSTMLLFKMALTAGADYDGWETKVLQVETVR